MSEITRNPLCWPDNVPRRAPHQRGNPQFKTRSLAEASSFVLQEINRLNNRHWNYQDRNVIISSNLRLKQDGVPYSQQNEPADTGMAVYFSLVFRRNGRPMERPIVMSCDKWRLTSDNLYAIGKDIQAQRSRDRWGCTNLEQSFRGYMAIPEKCGGAPWWIILQVPSNADKDVIERSYRQLAKICHPDNLRTGSEEKFKELAEAFEQGMAQFR